MDKKRYSLIGIDIFLLLGALLLCVLLWKMTIPVIQRVSYKSAAETQWQETTYPPSFSSSEKDLQISLQFHLSELRPLSLRITPNDCITALLVNEEPFENTAALPYCHHMQGRTFFLPFQSGTNVLIATLRNHGEIAGLSISVPWYDPIRLCIAISMALIGTMLVKRIIAFTHRKKRRENLALAFSGILVGGILLRVLYFFLTPFLTRGHDIYGHLEYVQYIATHWSIPAAKDGWQFYQPPLYYILTGAWYALGNAFGRSKMALITDLQFFSLVVSLVTFLVATLWIGQRLLFPKKTQWKELLLFSALIAVFPSLIFFAARINNDVLALLWMTLAIGYLLRWWQHRSTKDWILCFLLLCLGILTKSNVLLLVPAPFLCLLVCKKIRWKRKISLACIGLALIALLTGWHAYLRFGIEKHVSVVANITHLNQLLRVDDSFASITTFNPIRIIEHPYDQPFGPRSDRNFFWEYLFRSAFFGEFQFGQQLFLLCSLILALALLLSPAIGIGIWQSIQQNSSVSLPMLLALFLPLLGHVLYRQTAPYSSSQDFRYSIIILIPACFFLLIGIRELPRVFRSIAYYAVIGFIVLCILLIILLPS